MSNIHLAYVLSFLNKSWLWLGIWILYYLQFTDYSGLGLLESIMIFTSIITEIPTGAVADMLGKKNTLFLAFLFSSTGNLIMGSAPNFFILCVSIIVMVMGSSFYSGTMEALVYDSLKDEKKEYIFDKVMANIATLQLIAFSLASVVGGYLYAIKPGLPFLLLGLIHAIGALITLMIKEPAIDTNVFNLTNYVNQTKQGFRELFKTINIKKQTILLLGLSFFIVVAYESLNDILLYEFSFNEKQLGIIAAIIYIASAGASQLAPIITKKLKPEKSALLMGIVTAITFILSPFISMIIGGISVLVRNASQVIFENNSAVLINKTTDSKYRATTLSTFEMIKKIPYIFTAYVLGRVMDLWSGKLFAFWLGILMLLVLVGIYVQFNKSQKSESATLPQG